jgi:hypothetical protein
VPPPPPPSPGDNPPPSTPEPASIVLAMCGIGLLTWRRKRPA